MPVTQSLNRKSSWNPIPLYNDAVFFATANTAKNYTVPLNTFLLSFACPVGNFGLRVGGVAAWAAADVPDGSSLDVNPTERVVSPGMVISIIGDAANQAVYINCYNTRFFNG